MTDLTPETLAEWRKDASSPDFSRPRSAPTLDVRILALLDALAAEKERSNTIPRYAMLDVWVALRGSDQSQAFEPFRDEHGYAETWARLMHDVRAEKAAREEAERNATAHKNFGDEARRGWSVWEASAKREKARADKAEQERRAVREEAIEMEEAWERATERAVAAEARVAELESGMREMHNPEAASCRFHDPLGEHNPERFCPTCIRERALTEKGADRD